MTFAQGDEGREASAAGSGEHRPAGPVTGDGGALRADGPSSTPPSPVPPAGGAPESADEAIEHDLDALLADTQRERDEYLDLAKRTKADFENYRKRMAAEVQAAAARGKAELARQLIDPVDNLERALLAAGVDPKLDPKSSSPEDGGADSWAYGVLLVLNELTEALARNEIEAIAPQGERFDPAWHEALSMKPAEGSEPGIVAEVMQKGYRLGDQCIRPARVVVTQ